MEEESVIPQKRINYEQLGLTLAQLEDTEREVEELGETVRREVERISEADEALSGNWFGTFKTDETPGLVQVKPYMGHEELNTLLAKLHANQKLAVEMKRELRSLVLMMDQKLSDLGIERPQTGPPVVLQM